MGTVRFGFGLFTFGLIRVGSKWIGFETDWVISGVCHFGSYQILGSVRLWVGLLEMFGSKSVVSFRMSVRVWIRVVRFGCWVCFARSSSNYSAKRAKIMVSAKGAC